MFETCLLTAAIRQGGYNLIRPVLVGHGVSGSALLKRRLSVVVRSDSIAVVQQPRQLMLGILVQIMPMRGSHISNHFLIQTITAGS